MNRIQLLSSDAFEGRAPGSAGEEKTVEYLIESFRSFGLASGRVLPPSSVAEITLRLYGALNYSPNSSS